MPVVSTHLRAILQALFVTFLWSVSFVLIKIGLQALPALTFAGLRYTLAALVLLALVALSPGRRAAVRGLTRRDWAWLLTLGVAYYSITQGTGFVALAHLPSTTVSMVLSFTVVVVALLGRFFLGERLIGRQWLGMAVALIGAFIYLYPVALPVGAALGLAAVVIGMLTNAASTVMGRYVNRGGLIPPLVVTTVSMSVGALLLLGTGLALEGWPTLGADTWLLVGVLAVVNTAFAFTLWNRTQRVLPAAESTIINNTMLIQIALLAWVFLGEALDAKAVIGLAVALVGTLLVQGRPR